MSKSSYRPRRTRIYGANYDIGESYYKKQLDDLDHKRGIGRASDAYSGLSSNTFHSARESSMPARVTFDDEDDSRLNFSSSLRKKLYADDDDIDFSSTFKPSKFSLSEQRKKLFMDDEDIDSLGSTFKSLKFKANGTEEPFYGESITRKVIKQVRETPVRQRLVMDDLDDEEQGTFTSRRLKIRSENISSEDKSEAASSRMKATKARLADLESEMVSMTEKHNERAQRSHNLRKLLQESDSDTYKAIEN